MKKWFGIVLALPLILAGCNMFNRDFSGPPEGPDPTKGSLILLLDGATLPTQTIAPTTVDMQVYRYHLIFFFAGTEEFNTDIYAGDNFLFYSPQMVPGSWKVRATAHNEAGALIGAYGGSDTDEFDLLISKGPNIYSLPVIPLDGTGGLDLTVVWPNITGGPDTLEATLGTSDLSPNFVLTITGDNKRSYRYNDSYPSYPITVGAGHTTGYQILVLKIRNGATLAWGWMEAVRFLKDQNTVGSFEVLSFGDTGTLNLTLTGNPVIITPSSTIDILDAFDLPPELAFTLNGTLTSQIVYALVAPLPPGDSA
jgi:hypothetical protein